MERPQRPHSEPDLRPPRTEAPGFTPPRRATDQNQLDRIREILDGARSREQDERLAGITEEIRREVRGLRDIIDRELAAVRAETRAQLDEVREEAAAQRELQLRSFGTVQETLQRLTRDLEDGLETTRDGVARDLKGAHRELSEMRRLHAQLVERVRDLARETGREMARLRHETVPPARLATLLRGLAAEVDPASPRVHPERGQDG